MVRRNVNNRLCEFCFFILKMLHNPRSDEVHSNSLIECCYLDVTGLMVMRPVHTTAFLFLLNRPDLHNNHICVGIK